MENNKQLSYAKAIADELGVSLPTPCTHSNLDAFIQQHKREYYEKKDQELREQIVNEIKIVDFAAEIGFTVVKKGKYFSLKEHDSVMINPIKNCYWRNSVSLGGGKVESGSVIDFAKNFTSMSIKEIMSEFQSRLGENQISMFFPKENLAAASKVQELVLPDAAPHYKNVFAYLTKTRHIEANIVQDFVRKKMLFMDTHNNCVFVSRDENGSPVFASLRGTNTYKKFVGDVENSDYKKGFFIDNKSNKLFITESVIDAMSVMNIFQRQGQNFREYNYLPLNGATKFDSIIYQIDRNPDITEVFIGLDNDRAGIDNTTQIKELIQKNFSERVFKLTELFPEHTKDWNEELKYYDDNGLSFENFFDKKKKKKAIQNTKTYVKNATTLRNAAKFDFAVAYEMDMD